MSLSANRSLILWISLIWQCTTLLRIGEPEKIQESTVRKRRRHLSTTSAELQSPGAIVQIIFLSVLIWLYQIKKIKIGISLLPNCAFPEPCLLTNQRFLAVISFGIISWSLKKLVYKLKDLRSLFGWRDLASIILYVWDIRVTPKLLNGRVALHFFSCK